MYTPNISLHLRYKAIRSYGSIRYGKDKIQAKAHCDITKWDVYKANLQSQDIALDV